MFVAAAEVATLAGAAPAIRTEIDARRRSSAVPAATALVERASELADVLDGIVPGDLRLPTSPLPVAYRWKTQINENAKHPGVPHSLPEMDHNEIVGWDARRRPERFSAVFLDDRDQHPRERQRFELTAELIEPAAARRADRGGGGDAHRAHALDGHAGRPRLARARREARRRSLAGRVIERLKAELGKL